MSNAGGLPAAFFFGAVGFRVAAPSVQRRQDFVATTQRSPQRIVDVQPDFVLAFALAVGFAAEVRQIGNPDDAIKRNVFVINQDDR